VNATWTVVTVVGVATIAIKALGPVLMGGRPLPARLARIATLLAPALLAALVAINTIGADRRLTADARLMGVAAGAVAIWLRAPILIVILVAAATTALLRAVG
jgi:branched-subunit amino acid transport protein